jgi:hypothetical protein
MPKGEKMIHIYYGDNRAVSDKNAKKILGENYETIDAENLEISDLPTLFLGTSLFETESRKILIRGLAEKKELFDELSKYLETPHEIVILETKIDGKWASFKELKKAKNIDIVENKFEEDASKRFLAFNIYDLALKNPENAAKLLRENKEDEDPYAMLGAWATSAIKNLKSNPTSKQNRNIVKELAKIDVLIKTTKFSDNPWILLESFILRLKTL